MADSNDFGKSICSICYEDLKPLVEDLQAISICGHVFHELCLQQWLEYCNGKKSTCPVCKQRCCQENVNRLYFQSLGDPADLIHSQKPSIGRGREEQEKDPSVLRKEVKKLEKKLSGLNIAFERQQQELKELNQELDLCKENTSKESTWKNEALQQKTLIHQKLQSKTEELVRTLSECSRLQERNIALAKELAALKLVSDLNLEEEEMVKLASFGNGNNNKDTIDVLKKSLVLRNKSYKELMTQCNLLGRGETRSLKKLEKAKERMKKLKTRVQELEMALEEKDNEVLRVLKASKKTSYDNVGLKGVKSISITPLDNKCSTEDQMTNENQGGGSSNPPSQFRKTLSFDFNKDSGASTFKKKDINIIDTDPEKDFSFMANENVSERQSAGHEHSSPLNPCTNAACSENVNLLKSFSRPTPASDTVTRASMPGQSSSFGLLSTENRKDIRNISVCAMEEDVVEVSAPSSVIETVILDDMKEESPLLHIRKESAVHLSTSGPGVQCFAGGLVGPDGGNRYFGKWCKRKQTDASTSTLSTAQGPNTSMGDLIASGADGRGGRIKVLRTDKQSDNTTSTSMQKRCKNGDKQKGCLQIEDFFGKANRS